MNQIEDDGSVKGDGCLRRNWCVLLGAALVIGFIVSTCAFLRILRPQDIAAFMGMAEECPPIWKQFAFRRFGSGDPAPELFRHFPPTHATEFGRYGIYSFSTGPAGFAFTSVSVATRDGKLLAAGAASCTWQFTFFNTPDPELDRQYTIFMQGRRRESEQRRLGRLDGELRKFYDQHDRWPTNEAEFGWFVTGTQPPDERARSAQQQFRARYGLGKRASSDLYPNLLGITLHPLDDGSITLASKDLPDLLRTLANPNR